MDLGVTKTGAVRAFWGFLVGAAWERVGVRVMLGLTLKEVLGLFRSVDYKKIVFF